MSSPFRNHKPGMLGRILTSFYIKACREDEREKALCVSDRGVGRTEQSALTSEFIPLHFSFGVP